MKVFSGSCGGTGARGGEVKVLSFFDCLHEIVKIRKMEMHLEAVHAEKRTSTHLVEGSRLSPLSSLRAL